MNILAILTEKPWLSPGLHTRMAVEDDEARAQADLTVGLGVFLGVVTALFGLVTTAYLMRMGVHGPLGHGGADWGPIAEPPLLWVNTGLLALSGLALSMAAGAARQGNSPQLRNWLLAGGALAVVFLVGQIAVWQQLDNSGYFLAIHSALCTAVDNPLARPSGPLVTGNPAVAFFYLITALHGLHILGGLVAWGRVTARVLRGSGTAAVAHSVALCARYWHFLFFVWLVMFGLLLMT